MKHSNRVTKLFLVFGAALFALVCSHPISAQATNTFANTGNAGAGTTNPQGKLVVSSTNGPGANTGDLVLENPTAYANGNPRTSAISFKTNNPDSLLGYESASIRALMTPSTGITSPQALLQFWTASNTQGLVERMRITEDGNVGIGTTSPSWTLHTRSASTGVGFSNSDFALGATGTVFNIAYGASTGNTYTSLQTTTAGGTVVGNTVLQKDGGNVGIGTTSPSYPLQVFNPSANNFNIQSQRNGGAGVGIWTSTAIGAMYTTNNFPLELGVNGSSDIAINTSHNVGIGTTSPSYPLQVFNPSANNFNIQSQRDGGAGVGIWTSTAIGALYTTNNFPLELGVNGSSDIAINTSHNVGIGTPPGSNYKLDVSGSVNISGPSGSGNLTVSGSIAAKYQDVAEWVPASEQLSTGTVVVLDSSKSNQVTSSSTSYDTRVAGVVSEQPGIALGEKSEGKVLVATTGRVRVKVDATKGPIRIGDLLVTSDTPGVAMKSEAVNLGGVQFHRPGTLIGKALEPLEKGKGDILVLLSLQ